MSVYEVLRGSHSDKSATLVRRCQRGDPRQEVDSLSNEMVEPPAGSFAPGDQFSTPKDMLRFNSPGVERFALVE